MEPMIVISVLDYNELVMDKVKFLENIKELISETGTSDMWTARSMITAKLNSMIEDEMKKFIKPA